jgi:hypothetical protein
MADKTDFSQMDPAEVLKQLDQFSGDAVKASNPAIGTFAKFQEQRAARLNKGLKQIKKDVGETDPAYLAAKAAAERAASMNVQFKAQATRLQKRPVLKDFEWMVFGQVLDAAGNPAKGLRVRVFDRDRKYDDLLGDTQTDDQGEFSAIYHERDFKESGENLPELYVMVSDNKGTELYSSRDELRFNAGRSEYFLIRLGKPSRADNTNKQKKSKASSARRR